MEEAAFIKSMIIHPTQTLEFDLYFDETGEFLETSTDPSERKKAKQKYPSQIAGFLVPHHDIRAEATSIVSACKQAAGLRPAETFKGSALPNRNLGHEISDNLSHTSTDGSRVGLWKEGLKAVWPAICDSQSAVRI